MDYLGTVQGKPGHPRKMRNFEVGLNNDSGFWIHSFVFGVEEPEKASGMSEILEMVQANCILILENLTV